MGGKLIYESADHRVYLFEELTPASAVQANQYLIVHRDEAILLDPGGHKVQSKLFSDLCSLVQPKKIRHIFLSHQDPDVVASINYWLMTTPATAYISELWVRFLPHFGLDSRMENRVVAIGDRGMKLTLGGDCELYFMPAHFLHSPGNFHVYDPVSKILFSGDLGASLGQDYFFVEDFDSHIRYIEKFHKRYMASNRAMRTWAQVVRKLDVETIAPQHGAIFKGRDLVERFLDWAENLECGVDLISERDYTLP